MHIPPCLKFKRPNIEDYCNWCFTSKALQKTYNEVVHPMSESNLDPKEGDVIVLPLNLKRGVGRPRKNRMREKGEKRPETFKKRSCTVKCNLCKQFGHNSRTYQRDIAKQLQRVS